LTFKPQKIAILLPSLKFGGAERVALNLAKAFQEDCINIDILLMSFEGEFLAEAQKNFNVIDLNCNKTYKLPIKLCRYIASSHPDAIISSFWKLNLCACTTRFFFPSVRLILWEHALIRKSSSTPAWLFGISASLFYQLSTKIVAVSTGVSDDIKQITFGLRSKLLVIFNPIDSPSASPDTCNERQVEKQIIWVGRMDELKNPHLMLEAFSMIPLSCNARLVFMGDGNLRYELEQKCKEIGLWNRTVFLGYQSNPYVEISRSDLLVLTSNQEGFGNVIVEAMFCGLRVVSTDCGQGIHDILLNNRYGTIVPTKSPILLARAIESELSTHRDSQMQRDGAHRFLPRIIAQQFLSALQNRN
jgi:glycosyltransferase involved in cell wall biosynthesis